jgi:MinD-like ATPase involved in chromosome partitioning or flagellar assembly
VPGQAGGLLGGGLGVPEQRDGEAQGAGAGPERPSGEHSVPGQAGGLPGGLGVPEQRDGAAQGLGAGPASGGPQQPGAAGQEAAGQEAAGQGRGPWSLLVPGQAGSDPLGAGAGERASGVAQDAPGPEREAQDSLAPGAGEMDDAGLQAWTAALAESGSGWPAEPGSDEPEQAGHWSEAADASEAAEAEAVESAAGESVGESVGEATADAEWDGGRPRRLPPITIVPAQRFSAGAEKAREGAAEPAGDDTAARQSRDGIADARPREGGLPDTSAPAVERALGRPGVRPAAGWRTHVTVVPGGQGPGRPDPIKEAKARAVLPLDRPHLVMVLGCTVGAGQTVTAWMIAELLASLRGEPVAALDLNPGPASLKELAGLPAIPVSTLLGPRAHTGQPAHAAPRRERAAKGTRAAPPRPDVICDDPAGEGSWTAGGSGISGGPGGPGIRLVTSEDTDGADTGGADTGGRAPEGWAPEGSAAGQAASADFADFGLGPDAGEFGPGEFGPGEFGHGTGGHARAGYAGGLSGRPSRLFEFLASRYPVTLVDPGAAAVGRVLPAADQLVLVAPASPDAARAVGMTLEWLHANGHGILSANSIVVLNGVSQRSVPHAEQAGLVVRGRCRAIVRVPWDDHLAEPEAERGIRDSLARADTPSRLERLRPPVLQAYTALAGVLVSALAAGPQRGRAAR